MTFRALSAALRRVTASGSEQRLAALGRAYIDFGLADPALFDLMFRPSELHPDDLGLQQAQQEAIATLNVAVADLAVPRRAPAEPAPSATPPLAMISWAFVHGFVVLVRGGALQSAADAGPDPTELARELTGLFAARMHREAPGEPGDRPTS